MSNDLNQCSFIGRLGKPVETRYMTTGKAVCNFSIAVGSSYKDASGEKKDQTEWINLVAYDKAAEICAEYLVKGSLIFVSGKMKTRKYTTKEGAEKYSTEIIVDKMQMLGGKSAESNDAAPARSAPAKQQQQQAPEDYDSDVPF